MQVQNITPNNYQNQTNYRKNIQQNAAFGMNVTPDTVKVLTSLQDYAKRCIGFDYKQRIMLIMRKIYALIKEKDGLDLDLCEKAGEKYEMKFTDKEYPLGKVVKEMGFGELLKQLDKIDSDYLDIKKIIQREHFKKILELNNNASPSDTTGYDNDIDLTLKLIADSVTK